VKMIRHQDIRMNFPSTALTNLSKTEEKALGIFVINKDSFSAISTCHHMIRSPSIFKA